MPKSVARYILILIIFFFAVPSCYAQKEKVGLSVDQSIFSFNLYPSEEQEFALKIKNIAGEKQRVKINRKDFSIGDNNKVAFLTDKNELFGLKDWVSAEGEDVWMMEAGEERLVKFIVKIPQDAGVGSHYGAVLFNILPEVDFENFQRPIVGGEIGTYIFVNVGGKISGSGSIKDFISPKIIEKEADFKVVFENRGNVHYIPYGEIKIKNILNGKKENHKLDKHFVFPGKSYSFEYKWQAPSVLGVYAAEAFFVDQAGRNLSETKLVFGKGFIIIAISAAIITAVVLIIYNKKRKANACDKNKTDEAKTI